MKNILLYTCAAAAMPLLAGCLDSKPPLWKTEYVSVIVNENSINYYYELDSTFQENPVANSAIDAAIRSAAFTAGGNIWLACNSPDKVMVFDALTGRTSDASVISDSLHSPRCVALYNNYVAVSNAGDSASDGSYPNSYVQLYQFGYTGGFQISKKLPCGSDAWGLLVYQDLLYVAAGNEVKVFDFARLDVAPRIIAGDAAWGNARQFVQDSAGNLWVSYSGGALQHVNTSQVAADKSYSDVPMDASGSIAITNGGNIVTFRNEVGYGYDTATIFLTNIADGAFTPIYGGRHYLRGVGVNRATGSIYTADVRKSQLLLLRPNGSLRRTQEVGAGTKQFLFFRVDRAI